ncbi:MAG: chloride channel protein, partial [bacterium]|nr:chloride channel protein [bacterium]
LANMVFERPPLFRLETVDASSAPEFVGFVAIGVCGALVAVVYMRAILCSARLARKVPVPDYLKPMLAGAALGLAALWIPDILGLGKETLRFAVIDQAFGAGELLVLVVAKILATAMCLGFGFAGGVFSPALLIGVLFGALAGNGAEVILGELHSEIAVYAICGMVAVTSAVIGAPLTTILIVFELTRNYDLATAAMVSVVFSNLVSYRIFGRSLFDVQLRMRGFDLADGRHKAILDQRLLEDYVSLDYTALSPDAPLDEAKSRLLEADRHEGYVVDANGIYLGTVTLAELELSPAGDARGPKVTVGQLARPEPLILTAKTTVWHAMEQMGDFVGESIPVLEAGGDGRLLGVVFEATVVKAYLDTTNRIREEENAGG